MGVKVNAQTNSNSDYIKCVQKMGDIIIGRIVSPLKFNEFLYRFTADYATEKTFENNSSNNKGGYTK